VRPGDAPVPTVLGHAAALRASGQPLPPVLERVASLLEEQQRGAWRSLLVGGPVKGSSGPQATPLASLVPPDRGGSSGGSREVGGSLPEPTPGAVLHVELPRSASAHECEGSGSSPQCGSVGGGSSAPTLRPAAADSGAAAGEKPAGAVGGGDEATGLRRRQSTTP